MPNKLEFETAEIDGTFSPKMKEIKEPEGSSGWQANKQLIRAFID